MLSKERSPKSLGSCAANSRLVGAQQRVSSGGAPGGPAPTTESTPADAASDPRMWASGTPRYEESSLCVDLKLRMDSSTLPPLKPQAGRSAFAPSWQAQVRDAKEESSGDCPSFPVAVEAMLCQSGSHSPLVSDNDDERENHPIMQLGPTSCLY